MMESKNETLIIMNKNIENKSDNKILKTNIIPYLDSINYGYQLIYLKKNNDELINIKSNFENIRFFSKFIILGDDDTVFNFIQNLLTHNDYDLLKKPIIIIPCGESNILAKNIGIYNIQDGINSILSEKNVKPYLSNIVQGNKIFYSFLGITWNSKLKSEKIINGEYNKWFDYNYYHNILTDIFLTKKINGKVILYLYPEDNEEIIEGDFSLFFAMNLPCINEENIFFLDKQINSKYFSILYIHNKDLSFLEKIKLYYYLYKLGDFENLNFITYKKVSSFKIIPYDNNNIITCDTKIIENKELSVFKKNLQIKLQLPDNSR